MTAYSDFSVTQGQTITAGIQNANMINIRHTINGTDATAAPVDSLVSLRTSITSNDTDISNLQNPTSFTATGNVTITDSDGYFTIFMSTSGTCTLPTLADNQDREIRIVKSFSTSGTVIIDGEGSETINSQSTINLTSNYDYIWLKALNNTVWSVTDHSITYESDWINRSDWTDVNIGSNTTKNADSAINHNFNCSFSEVNAELILSTTNADSAAWIVVSADIRDAVGGQHGISKYYSDANNTIIQSGQDGIAFVDNSTGGYGVMAAQDWWYKVKAERVKIL